MLPGKVEEAGKVESPGKVEEVASTIPDLPSPGLIPTHGRSIAACRLPLDTLGYTFASCPLAEDVAQVHTLSWAKPAMIVNPQCPRGIKS